MTAIAHATLRVAVADNSQTLGELAPGDGFEALDFAGGTAWGISTRDGLVGYIDRKAIDFLDTSKTAA